MIDVLLGWIDQLTILVIAIISLMAIGLMAWTWGRTKSAGAVVGVLAVGVIAIVGAANMGTLASWVGADLNKQVEGTELNTVCTEWGSCTNGGE